MNYKETITTAITNIVTHLYQITSAPIVDYTNDLSFGDFTTNIAMVIAKEVKKSPSIIAAEIAEAARNTTELKSFIKDIAAVNGFINLSLNDSILWETIYTIATPFGQGKTSKPQRILMEYGDPNSHKLPHIGHLFSYIVGDSLARIQEANGNSILKTTYQGDVGMHVAKALYGYIQLGQPKLTDIDERVQLLQKCYQEGSRAYDEDEVAKETIVDINKKVYAKDPEIYEMWKETRQWSVDYYQYFEQRLGITIQYHYWESEIADRGKQTVLDNVGTVFEKSDGAIIFRGEQFGLHNRVFINQQGNPTYEAKDMGLNVVKHEDWPYDLNVITTASEQNGYFDVILKAFDLCYPKLAGKIKHIGFGMVSLSTGKMSSRTGQILSALDLLDSIKKEVASIVEQRPNLTDEQKNNITEKVTLAAIKFAFLKQNILLNVKFDPSEAISFDGKTGPYLQYTYARIQSVLKQHSDLSSATTADGKTLVTDAENILQRFILRFPDIVAQAGKNYAPHLVAEYTYQLAQYFNSFYTSCPINTAPTEELVRARRLLAEKTALVLKKGLMLLGIETVEQM